MSKGKTNIYQQKINQLSQEQEQRIVDWASDERLWGTSVSRNQIQWYAERLHQRQEGTETGTLSPRFADDFLQRHSELAESLLISPPPRPPSPSQPAPKPGRSFAERTKERMRKLREEALYGDSPPPPRQAAPYPDGEIIHSLLERHIVRHGDTVTKYTTSSNGFGVGKHPSEALALQFVKEHTTIPVPKVISSDWDRVTMEYVEGQTLKQAWLVLTPDEQRNILAQLSGYVKQLQALRGLYIGRLDGQGAVVPSIITRSGGPFQTTAEFQDWLATPRASEPESIYWNQVTAHLGQDYPINFTHGDIAARNIMVRDGQIVAILDWEYAGWYPVYWDYVFTLRGMDNIDWETLGLNLPSIFPSRYDLEYVLVHFVLTLS